MRTAVIGAGGLIGKRLHRRCRQLDDGCLGTVRRAAQEGQLVFDLRRDGSDLIARLVDTGHLALVLCAALSSLARCESDPVETRDVNVRSTLRLAELAGRAGLRVVYLSSDYVFDGSVGSYAPEAVPAPKTEYGRQKAEVERVLPELTEHYRIVRLSKVYALVPGDGTLIDEIGTALLQKRPMRLAIDQRFSPTWVEDVVEGILAAQHRPHSGCWHVCAREAWSRWSIASELSRQLELPMDCLSAVCLGEIQAMAGRPLKTDLVPSADLRVGYLPLQEAVRRWAEAVSTERSG